MSFTIPSLPDDVLLDIFSFCSPQTLAACTRTSYKFLSLASPILYREVSLVRKAQLFILFARTTSKSKRTSLVPRDLRPFLSIYQIRIIQVYHPDTDLVTTSIPRGRYDNRYEPFLPLDWLVIRNADALNFQPVQPLPDENSLFHHLQPTRLALVFNGSHYEIRGTSLPSRLYQLRGIVRDVVLVGGWIGDVVSLFHRGQRANRLWIVMRNGVDGDSVLGELLRDLRGSGILRFEGFGRVRGAVTIEVGSETAKEKVEKGRSLLSFEENRIVKIQVKGSRWW